VTNRVLITCPVCDWRAQTIVISPETAKVKPTSYGPGVIITHLRHAHGWDLNDMIEFCLQLMMGEPIVTEDEQARIRQALNTTTIPRVPPLRLVDKEPPT